MYLPPLQPIVNSEIQICGDVEIHPTASIAPGVILKAAPNARIVIGADVCLGMGVILNAYKGAIEIEAGVALGSGVLIIGSSKIGANACIGTTTTIFNTSIAAMTVINPGSLIGDLSRSSLEDDGGANERTSNSQQVIESETKTFPPRQQATPENNRNSEQEPESEFIAIEEEIITNNIANSDPWEQPEIPISTSQVEVNQPDENSEIVPELAIGKVYIDQLLVTLFPHKNSLNNNPNDNSK